ncbi:MAG TPA: amidase family protein, partial [Polyangiaceae bacterium]
TSLPGVAIASGIRRRVERVASKARRAGARVAEKLPALDWNEMNALSRDLPMAILSVFNPHAELPTEQRTLAWYMTALHRRDRLISAFQAFFYKFDALLLPSGATPAFSHREPGLPIELGGETIGYWDNGGLLASVNIAGLPSLTVPAGVGDDDLPIGVQLVGPLWSEMKLVAIARELERAEALPGFAWARGY